MFTTFMPRRKPWQMLCNTFCQPQTLCGKLSMSTLVEQPIRYVGVLVQYVVLKCLILCEDNLLKLCWCGCNCPVEVTDTCFPPSPNCLQTFLFAQLDQQLLDFWVSVRCEQIMWVKDLLPPSPSIFSSIKNIRQPAAVCNEIIKQLFNQQIQYHFGILYMLIIICLLSNLLLPMCHRSKKWAMTGFPISLHFLGHSTLIHLAIWECRSDMKAVISIPVPRRNANACWWPINSMAELLPASFAWSKKVFFIFCYSFMYVLLVYYLAFFL